MPVIWLWFPHTIPAYSTKMRPDYKTYLRIELSYVLRVFKMDSNIESDFQEVFFIKRFGNLKRKGFDIMRNPI